MYIATKMHKKENRQYSYQENLETSDIENTNEGSSLAFGAIQGLVDAGDQPLEEAFVDGFADGLHGKFNLS